MQALPLPVAATTTMAVAPYGMPSNHVSLFYVFYLFAKSRFYHHMQEGWRWTKYLQIYHVLINYYFDHRTHHRWFDHRIKNRIDHRKNRESLDRWPYASSIIGSPNEEYTKATNEWTIYESITECIIQIEHRTKNQWIDQIQLLFLTICSWCK